VLRQFFGLVMTMGVMCMSSGPTAANGTQGIARTVSYDCVAPTGADPDTVAQVCLALEAALRARLGETARLYRLPRADAEALHAELAIERLATYSLSARLRWWDCAFQPCRSLAESPLLAADVTDAPLGEAVFEMLVANILRFAEPPLEKDSDLR
jgi:hypothetical protein